MIKNGYSDLYFLAPSGAQQMLMFVCLSDESLSRALNFHLSLSGQSQILLSSVSGQSQVSLRSVSGQGQPQASLRSLLAYFVGKTEPRILRLV